MGELEGENQMGSKVQRGMGDRKVPASYVILLLYKTLPWVQESLDTLNSSPVLMDGFVKINMLCPLSQESCLTPGSQED